MNEKSAPKGALQTAATTPDLLEEYRGGPLPECYRAARATVPKSNYRPTPMRRALKKYDRPAASDRRRIAAELRRLLLELERAA